MCSEAAATLKSKDFIAFFYWQISTNAKSKFAQKTRSASTFPVPSPAQVCAGPLTEPFG